MGILMKLVLFIGLLITLSNAEIPCDEVLLAAADEDFDPTDPSNHLRLRKLIKEFEYLMPSVIRTFDEANQHCQNYGGSLVSIDDAEEERIIMEKFQPEWQDVPYWIGLKAKNETTKRQWIDGNDASFSRLEAESKQPYIPKMGEEMMHEHADANEGSEDCTAMVKLYGKNATSVWVRSDCQNHHSFICKRPAMAYHFQFKEEEKTFKEAQEYCVGWGGNLATLDEKKEKQIGDLLHVGVNYWIGLTTENEQKNKVAWINGVPVSYSNFRKDEEMRTEGHNCITILKETDSIGWTYRDCKEKRNFVCEELVDEYVALATIHMQQVDYCNSLLFSPASIIIPLVLLLICVAIGLYICKCMGLICKKEKKLVEIEVVPEGDDDKEDPLKVGGCVSSDGDFQPLATVDMPSAINSRVNSDEDIYCKEMNEKYEVPVPCKFGPWPSDPPAVPFVPMMMEQIPKPEIELLTMVEDEDVVQGKKKRVRRVRRKHEEQVEIIIPRFKPTGTDLGGDRVCLKNYTDDVGELTRGERTGFNTSLSPMSALNASPSIADVHATLNSGRKGTQNIKRTEVNAAFAKHAYASQPGFGNYLASEKKQHLSGSKSQTGSGQKFAKWTADSERHDSTQGRLVKQLNDVHKNIEQKKEKLSTKPMINQLKLSDLNSSI